MTSFCGGKRAAFGRDDKLLWRQSAPPSVEMTSFCGGKRAAFGRDDKLL
jgi:hypothetical protein